MGMLGNSTRGLAPLQKWLLYRTCVIPIATYSHRLWFYRRPAIRLSWTSSTRCSVRLPYGSRVRFVPPP
ncbi:hypothetical protein CVT24_006873 [Panaeolus cyanescens]|uniref:Uncharacterized protein n=1 Tax=Panaeolus cyanescens TaxID=181874 RepID=A0A409YWZ0_9AGAR|nr:hypothetical protein CVT24_006873 [Panaeolus cyanescens]